MDNQLHLPVLADEVLNILHPRNRDRYLDLTAGYGGHASIIANKVGKDGQLTLVDRDVNAIEVLAERFTGDERVMIYQNDYLTASRALATAGAQFDCILADIGVSSPHLDNPDRGFSYRFDGPLDMRMDQSQELTAQYILNEWTEDQLVVILHDYGEVRGSKRIASKLIEARPIQTTDELTAIIKKCTSMKLHTKVLSQVFQALRIAVNDELGQLAYSLPLWHQLLAPGGRLAIISFHSLEDRIVKQYFAEHAGNRYDSDLKLLSKQAITASHNEIVSNPRARSAKLRAVQRK